MDYDSPLIETRTNVDHNEMDGDFRVSFESLRCPPRPGEAQAWGEPDGDILAMWTPDGLWFVSSLSTGKNIKVDYGEPKRLTEADAIRLAHEAADCEPTPVKCYFIGAEDGPVKIGFSVNVEKRLKVLQLSSPFPLKVLAVADGGAQREAAYHWQFADTRLHGEWFERTPELLAEIDRLAKPSLCGLSQVVHIEPAEPLGFSPSTRSRANE